VRRASKEQINVGTTPDVSICTALLEMNGRVTQKSLIREARSGRERERMARFCQSKLYSHTSLRTFVGTEIYLLVVHTDTLYRDSKQERSIFWEVILSVILNKKCICTCVLFRTVSELELFHFIASMKKRQDTLRQATRHVAKWIDVDAATFENILS
jgi:hypothetical protein